MHLTDLVLFAQAASPAPGSPTAPGGGGGGGSMMIIQLVLIMVIFYFLLIRPQTKKQKEHQKLVSALQTGDEVITNAGIHGVITNVKEKTVIVRIADNVKVEFDRGAITTVNRPTSEKAS